MNGQRLRVGGPKCVNVCKQFIDDLRAQHFYCTVTRKGRMKSLPGCCHDSVRNQSICWHTTPAHIIMQRKLGCKSTAARSVFSRSQRVAGNTFLSSPARSQARIFCATHIHEAFLAAIPSCDECAALHPPVTGLRLASRWLLTLSCGLRLHGVAV